MCDDNNCNSFYKVGAIKCKPDQFSKNWEKLLEKGKTVSVMFTGVGGQGIILAATVLSGAAFIEGYDIKISEVHGMAQRGGSVTGSVRIGKKVYSPVIERADFIISLEKLEGLRYLNMLDKDGFILINDFEIYPVTVFMGKPGYPENIIGAISEITENYMLVRATDMAESLNEIRVSNIILLGCFSNFIPFSEDSWLDSIRKNIPRKALDLNLKAFYAGRSLFN